MMAMSREEERKRERAYLGHHYHYHLLDDEDDDRHPSYRLTSFPIIQNGEPHEQATGHLNQYGASSRFEPWLARLIFLYEVRFH